MATVMVRDESAAGVSLGEFPLEFPSERITVRELIRERVYQEVQDYELERRKGAHRLVVPEGAEARLNPSREPKERRPIDWKRQVEIACDAFERNGFFVLVGDRQAESLEESVELGRGVSVSFVKLTPLVGG